MFINLLINWYSNWILLNHACHNAHCVEKDDIGVIAFTDGAKSGVWYFDSGYIDPTVYDDFPIKILLLFSCTMFFIAILGITFNRKNIINLIFCIELMLFSLSLNFIFLSLFLSSPAGQVFALVIVCIAAADSAIGLGILIAAFRVKRDISFEASASLKG